MYNQFLHLLSKYLDDTNLIKIPIELIKPTFIYSTKTNTIDISDKSGGLYYTGRIFFDKNNQLTLNFNGVKYTDIAKVKDLIKILNFCFENTVKQLNAAPPPGEETGEYGNEEMPEEQQGEMGMEEEQPEGGEQEGEVEGQAEDTTKTKLLPEEAALLKRWTTEFDDSIDKEKKIEIIALLLQNGKIDEVEANLILALQKISKEEFDQFLMNNIRESVESYKKMLLKEDVLIVPGNLFTSSKLMSYVFEDMLILVIQEQAYLNKKISLRKLVTMLINNPNLSKLNLASSKNFRYALYYVFIKDKMKSSLNVPYNNAVEKYIEFLLCVLAQISIIKILLKKNGIIFRNARYAKNESSFNIRQVGSGTFPYDIFADYADNKLAVFHVKFNDLKRFLGLQKRKYVLQEKYIYKLDSSEIFSKVFQKYSTKSIEYVKTNFLDKVCDMYSRIVDYFNQDFVSNRKNNMEKFKSLYLEMKSFMINFEQIYQTAEQFQWQKYENDKLRYTALNILKMSETWFKKEQYRSEDEINEILNQSLDEFYLLNENTQANKINLPSNLSNLFFNEKTKELSRNTSMLKIKHILLNFYYQNQDIIEKNQYFYELFRYIVILNIAIFHVTKKAWQSQLIYNKDIRKKFLDEILSYTVNGKTYIETLKNDILKILFLPDPETKQNFLFDKVYYLNALIEKPRRQAEKKFFYTKYEVFPKKEEIGKPLSFYKPISIGQKIDIKTNLSVFQQKFDFERKSQFSPSIRRIGISNLELIKIGGLLIEIEYRNFKEIIDKVKIVPNYYNTKNASLFFVAFLNGKEFFKFIYRFDGGSNPPAIIIGSELKRLMFSEESTKEKRIFALNVFHIDKLSNLIQSDFIIDYNIFLR